MQNYFRMNLLKLHKMNQSPWKVFLLTLKTCEGLITLPIVNLSTMKNYPRYGTHIYMILSIDWKEYWKPINSLAKILGDMLVIFTVPQL